MTDDQQPEALERTCQIDRCRNHVTADGRGTDLTCATCLGRTRQRVAAIVVMSTALLGEAIKAGARGLTSEAFALAGPAADPEAWGYRRMSALAQRIDPGWLDDQIDMHHPAWVLGTWAREIREHLTLDATPRPTLTEAAALLDQHLTRLAHDPDFAYTELDDDIRLCHDHIERVLHLDEHHDRGVKCPECEDARLRKEYADDERDDRWVCSACRQWWSDKDYRTRIADDLVEYAPTLTLTDMATRVRVAASTLRTWAQREVIKPVGRDHNGRKTYDVKAVEAARDARAEISTREAG